MNKKLVFASGVPDDCKYSYILIIADEIELERKLFMRHRIFDEWWQQDYFFFLY